MEEKTITYRGIEITVVYDKDHDGVCVSNVNGLPDWLIDTDYFDEIEAQLEKHT